MNANDVRLVINDNPQGVTIRMIDGTKYDVPHRDWVWMTPAFGGSESRFGRYSTCFGVYHDDALRWVNCLLVAEIVPKKSARSASDRNGHSNGRGGGGRKKKR